MAFISFTRLVKKFILYNSFQCSYLFRDVGVPMPHNSQISRSILEPEGKYDGMNSASEVEMRSWSCSVHPRNDTSIIS